MCVVDLETAGTWNDSVIFSLGLSFGEYTMEEKPFDQLVTDGLYVKFAALPQYREMGRTMDKDTMAWWASQGESAKAVIRPSPEDIAIERLPEIFDEFFVSKGVRFKDCDVYDRRSFDMTKLEHLYKVSLGRTGLSWNYMNEFEVSTALRFMGKDRYASIKPSDIKGMIYHNALHDAVLDHVRLQKTMIEIGMIS